MCGGKTVREHLEVVNIRDGWEWLQGIVQAKTSLTEETILHLHLLVTQGTWGPSAAATVTRPSTWVHARPAQSSQGARTHGGPRGTASRKALGGASDPPRSAGAHRSGGHPSVPGRQRPDLAPAGQGMEPGRPLPAVLPRTVAHGRRAVPVRAEPSAAVLAGLVAMDRPPWHQQHPRVVDQVLQDDLSPGRHGRLADLDHAGRVAQFEPQPPHPPLQRMARHERLPPLRDDPRLRPRHTWATSPESQQARGSGSLRGSRPSGGRRTTAVRRTGTWGAAGPVGAGSAAHPRAPPSPRRRRR